MTVLLLSSRFRCPYCGHEELHVMPTDACVYFHTCVGCATIIRPALGDCCVFCSYGSVRCPPAQVGSGQDCCTPEPL